MKELDFEKRLITSIMPETNDEFIQNITNCKTKIVEHRLDGLLEPKNFQLKYFDYNYEFLATIRPQNPKAHNFLTENERVQLLKQSIENGAKWVDIEIETRTDLLEDLLQYAKEKHVTTILSYHNYIETPDKEILENLVQSMIKTGADIVKCVTTANDYVDAHRMMDIQIKWSNKVMAFAMGTLGSYSRVISLLHNAPYAYVPLNKKTAPGQLDIDDFKTILSLLA